MDKNDNVLFSKDYSLSWLSPFSAEAGGGFKSFGISEDTSVG